MQNKSVDDLHLIINIWKQEWKFNEIFKCMDVNNHLVISIA